MPNRLFIDEIVSVGAVADGDNPDAEIVFWKSKTESFEDIPEGDVTKRDVSIEERKPETKNRLTVPFRKGDRMAEFDFDGFTDDQRTAVETVFAEYEETIANLEEEEEDVTKGAPPEVQELIAKQAAELETAMSELAKERKVRRDADFIAKAKELETVLGSPEEWGPILDELEAGAPDAYGKLSERLVAVKAQVETGELFKELGSAGDGELNKLEALTKAKMELNPELTIEQARVQVRRENPEIVEEERSL